MLTGLVEQVAAPDTPLRRYLAKKQHPILCVGPMSRNCVDAVIRAAHRLQRPIPLIASRRQVECDEFGGGYVNGWDTETFAHYVKFKGGQIVPLCRDHGGPWQRGEEKNLPQYVAMQRAKRALLRDIEAGFDLVHLDPSPDGETLMEPLALQRMFELYAYVCEVAYSRNIPIEIEVGTEASCEKVARPEEYEFLVRAVLKFCECEGYQPPLFCIAQTGTLVRELGNVGVLGKLSAFSCQNQEYRSCADSVRTLAAIAKRYGVHLKEHNADYLPENALSDHKSLGISALNIAPQLGVFESRCLVGLCIEFKLESELDRILEIFYASSEWHKWLNKDSNAGDVERALMAGHYTFSSNEFRTAKDRIAAKITHSIADLDHYLSQRLEALLLRICKNLGYLECAQIEGESLSL